MKVVQMTSAHPPLDVRIFHKECVTLAGAGHDVVLVSPPSEELRSDEIIDGVQLRLTTKPAGRLSRMTFGAARTFRAAMRERADFYHFHDPELIPYGLLLKLLGRRVVYDVHEDLPRQVAHKYWIPRVFRPVLARLCEVLEGAAAARFDGVVAATPVIGARFKKDSTAVVHNYPAIREFALDAGSTPHARRPMEVLYAGGIQRIRGVVEMVAAIEHGPARLGARLQLAGRFSPESLHDEVRAMSAWTHVDYRGWQSRDEIATLMRRARVGLVVLHPTRNYVESYPIKLFEYMAAGVPVVASDFPIWRQIVDGASCGLLVDPMDPRAIGQAVEWLLEHPSEAEEMGRRGAAAARAQYNWETEGARLLRFYAERMRVPTERVVAQAG